jgi:hypothetical protein
LYGGFAVKQGLARGITLAMVMVGLGLMPAYGLDWLSRPKYDAVAYAQEQADQSNTPAAGSCATCNQDFCDSCVGCPGLVGGAELLLMDPHNSAGNNIFGPGSAFTEWGYNPAWRFWLGYQGASGQGLRVRYFEFDQHEPYFDPEKLENAGVDSISLDYDAWYIDIEYFDTVQLGNWSALLHGGIRHAEATRYDTIVFAQTPDELYARRVLAKGWGLTAGAELRRPIIYCLNLYANLRGSILFGDSVGHEFTFVEGELVEEEGTFLENGIGAIWEIGTGVERTWDLGTGAQLFGRIGTEVQYWDGFSREWTNMEQGEAFGLFGWTLAIGMIR